MLCVALACASACESSEAAQDSSIDPSTLLDAGDASSSDAGGDADAGVAREDGGAMQPPADADASAGMDAGSMEPMMCLEATAPCQDEIECCVDLSCDTTSLGTVCCGEEGATCATENGEDCCRDLLCIAGRCGYDVSSACDSPCTAPPALTLERERLMSIGGSFLGICGDANHTYGYHVPAARLPDDDYSLEGAVNNPVCEWHAAAIDIGMDWPASREWLAWLIMQIQSGEITGIGEVIGSYDGIDVRYWSDSAGWSTEGDAYTGSGHDTWTHVAVHRSTALQDHGILAGWTATDGP
jgi:hypothetical protein